MTILQQKYFLVYYHVVKTHWLWYVKDGGWLAVAVFRSAGILPAFLNLSCRGKLHGFRLALAFVVVRRLVSDFPEQRQDLPLLAFPNVLFQRNVDGFFFVRCRPIFWACFKRRSSMVTFTGTTLLRSVSVNCRYDACLSLGTPPLSYSRSRRI
jgi:hypothetical protein